MNKEEERNYVFAQLSSLPNAFQYISVTNYIENLEQENKKYKEVFEKAIKYIEKCLKQTPIENRTKTDDILDIEYEYILKILKEVE